MSGEMNTSLGNGFSNLMTYLYLCECNGCTNLFVLVEGDDLLAQYKGRLFTADDYVKLGLLVKAIYLNNPNEASFCGQLFDIDSLTVITDPIKVCLTFGWSDISLMGARKRKYLSMIRAKALSYAHQYYQCPVIYPLMQNLIRLTSEYTKVKFRDKHLSYMYAQAIRSKNDLSVRNISDSTRLFMQDKYGLSVSDQLAFEAYSDGLSTIQPLEHPVIERYITPVMKQFDERFVKEVDSYTAFRCNLSF